jgi:hypothetical protein
MPPQGEPTNLYRHTERSVALAKQLAVQKRDFGLRQERAAAPRCRTCRGHSHLYTYRVMAPMVVAAK